MNNLQISKQTQKFVLSGNVLIFDLRQNLKAASLIAKSPQGGQSHPT
jgi:lipopolysaccharide export system protein LptA